MHGRHGDLQTFEEVLCFVFVALLLLNENFSARRLAGLAICTVLSATAVVRLLPGQPNVSSP
jgi:hypothetical protein